MKDENKVDCTGKHWIKPMHYRSENLESSLSGCRSEEREDSATLRMNEETFAVFYHSTVRPLWAYLSRVSGNPTLTDDLVQESYLRFLCARAPWQEGEIACRRYLFRIGTNLLRDQWRRPAGRSLEEIPEKKLPFVDPPNVEEMDSNKALNAALLQLRPVERQPLWLAHAEEMSYREIVEITGLGMARIRLTLFRSRHKVARALRQEIMKAGVR
jgi:RNA polymerase sigma-70 factor, ECF subfamily